MFEIHRIIVVILGICFVNVRGQDREVLRQNYSQVFTNMPELLERIMEMLHNRPEVLEKDDVTTFQDFETSNEKVSQLSPAENELGLNKREFNFKHDFNDDYGKNEAEPQYDVQLLRASDDFGAFFGSLSPGGYQLTADEVAERMLMVEQNLDEYNNDTK